MTPTLGELAAQPQGMTLSAVFCAGTAASVGLCVAIRLPIVVAYVAGAGSSKKHGVVLSVLFALGLITGTVLLGLTTASAGDGTPALLDINKYLFWGLGAGLLATGVLISGLISPQLLPRILQGIAERMSRVGMPGALLLGTALGLLQMPACPDCGTDFSMLVKAPALGGSWPGLMLLAAFAAGQSVVALGLGVVTGLLRPDLIAIVRTQMCSIERRTQLLAGNVLMALGIYFIIVG